MDIVVTGATSFIGSVTVRQLLEQGHRVYAVVRPGSANLGVLSGLEQAVLTGLERTASGEQQAASERRQSAARDMETGQMQVISLDMKAIRQITGVLERADAWVHIGWDGAGSENRTKREVQQANVRHSLEAVRAAADLGCRRFLFTGSQAEYGVYHQVISEEMSCHPVSEYGIAKVDFGLQAEELCRKLGMEYVHARIFSVYGPGDHPWSLVQSCLRTWNQSGEMKLGECTQQWNFLYIEDTASALVCLLTEGQSGVYNIAGYDTRPLREYIEEMYRLCGSRGSFRYGERPQNAEGPADLMPDIGKILRETGWRPVTTFAEGIYETMHCLQV